MAKLYQVDISDKGQELVDKYRDMCLEYGDFATGALMDARLNLLAYIAHLERDLNDRITVLERQLRLANDVIAKLGDS